MTISFLQVLCNAQFEVSFAEADVRCTEVPDPISSSARDSLLGAIRLAIVVLAGLAQDC